MPARCARSPRRPPRPGRGPASAVAGAASRASAPRRTARAPTGQRAGQRLVHPGHVESVVAAQVLAKTGARGGADCRHGSRPAGRYGARDEPELPVSTTKRRHHGDERHPAQRAQRVHVAPEIRARGHCQHDDVVRETVTQRAVAEQALRRAVAVHAEVDDLEAGIAARAAQARPTPAGPGCRRRTSRRTRARGSCRARSRARVSWRARAPRLFDCHQPLVERRVLAGRVAQAGSSRKSAAEVVAADAPRRTPVPPARRTRTESSRNGGSSLPNSRPADPRRRPPPSRAARPRARAASGRPRSGRAATASHRETG